MRGFALFWSLALASAALGWLGALAAFQAHADDAQVAMVALSEKRLIGADVRATLVSALVRAQGRSPAEKVADAALRLSKAEAFLESSYVRQGVLLDVFFGFLSDAEQDDWLDRMGKKGRIVKCARCMDVGPMDGSGLDAAPNLDVFPVLPVANILDGSANGGSVTVSKNGLHRGSLPFSTFGRPVLGAVFQFGNVLGVEVLGMTHVAQRGPD
ncbi:hypothetical protein HY994_04960 [Candidatus Micrarchaeota archaeon]|nr:hypothetical protein [Candidatus Micrarchaeota archaeon]